MIMIIIFIASKITDADSSGYANALCCGVLGSVAMALVADRSRVCCSVLIDARGRMARLLAPVRCCTHRNDDTRYNLQHPIPEIAFDLKDVVIFHESN
jgi:hypothetical protein